MNLSLWKLGFHLVALFSFYCGKYIWDILVIENFTV